MIIKSLELNNFRNYDFLKLNLDSNTNIFYGKNAQGKTNILEAIYMCATTKSHRTSRDMELIKFGKKDAHIKAYIEKRDIEYRIDIHIRQNRSKGIAINGIPIKKASELFGIFNVIFFSPEDLNIIKRGPAERRRFMDMELCQLDKVYVYNLTNYNKVLNQRNCLLRDISIKPELADTIDIWDEELIKYGLGIIDRRKKFIEDINKIIDPLHKNIAGKGENLQLKYQQNCSGDEFEEKLKEARTKDIKQKATTVGPHRDDILFMNGKTDVRVYGSQGQKRTAALSLKLSEIEMVKNLVKDTPVLLLDDVLSELDIERQKQLLRTMGDVQTLITCTGVDEFVEKRFSVNKVFRVSNGHVFEKNAVTKQDRQMPEGETNGQ